jgi:plasmid stability protein
VRAGAWRNRGKGEAADGRMVADQSPRALGSCACARSKFGPGRGEGRDRVSDELSQAVAAEGGKDPRMGSRSWLRCRLISERRYDIILGVLKQLLLRVPEDVHRRLAARARREGRSVNAVATEILDAAAAGDQGDRRARLRAAAAAAGTLRSVDARSVSAAQRRRIVGSTRGLGAQVDRLLAEERDRV